MSHGYNALSSGQAAYEAEALRHDSILAQPSTRLNGRMPPAALSVFAEGSRIHKSQWAIDCAKLALAVLARNPQRPQDIELALSTIQDSLRVLEDQTLFLSRFLDTLTNPSSTSNNQNGFDAQTQSPGGAS